MNRRKPGITYSFDIPSGASPNREVGDVFILLDRAWGKRGQRLAWFIWNGKIWTNPAPIKERDNELADRKRSR